MRAQVHTGDVCLCRGFLEVMSWHWWISDYEKKGCQAQISQLSKCLVECFTLSKALLEDLLFSQEQAASHLGGVNHLRLARSVFLYNLSDTLKSERASLFELGLVAQACNHRYFRKWAGRLQVQGRLSNWVNLRLAWTPSGAPSQINK